MIGLMIVILVLTILLVANALKDIMNTQMDLSVTNVLETIVWLVTMPKPVLNVKKKDNYQAQAETANNAPPGSPTATSAKPTNPAKPAPPPTTKTANKPVSPVNHTVKSALQTKTVPKPT